MTTGKEERARLNAELERVRQQLDESQKALETTKTKNLELEKNFEGQRGSIEALNAKLGATDTVGETNKQLQESIRQQERRIIELEKQNDEALERIESMAAKQNVPAKPRKSAKASSTANKRSNKPKAVASKPARGKKNSGDGDKLTKISGVGPVLQKRLNKFGITTFKQIAKWTKADVQEWETKLEWGAIDTDEWVRQAKKLA